MDNLPLIKLGEQDIQVSELELQGVELFSSGENQYRASSKQQSVDFEVVEMKDHEMTVLHNHLLFTVQVQNDLHQRIASMGWDKMEDLSLKSINAPMPGLVLEISVAEGDVVEKGTKVLVLEAMKMENVITVPANVTIGKIHITKRSCS